MQWCLFSDTEYVQFDTSQTSFDDITSTSPSEWARTCLLVHEDVTKALTVWSMSIEAMRTSSHIGKDVNWIRSYRPDVYEFTRAPPLSPPPAQPSLSPPLSPPLSPLSPPFRCLPLAFSLGVSSTTPTQWTIDGTLVTDATWGVYLGTYSVTDTTFNQTHSLYVVAGDTEPRTLSEATTIFYIPPSAEGRAFSMYCLSPGHGWMGGRNAMRYTSACQHVSLPACDGCNAGAPYRCVQGDSTDGCFSYASHLANADTHMNVVQSHSGAWQCSAFCRAASALPFPPFPPPSAAPPPPPTSNALVVDDVQP